MYGLKNFKFAISCLMQDAGEAIRAIEPARGLREQCPPHLQQKNLQKAYAKMTGREENPEMRNLFDMLRSDFA